LKFLVNIRNPQAHLSIEQANKEFKWFAITALVCIIVGLLFVGAAAIAAFAFSGRLVVLALHPRMKADKTRNLLIAISIFVVSGFMMIVRFS